MFAGLREEAMVGEAAAGPSSGLPSRKLKGVVGGRVRGKPVGLQLDPVVEAEPLRDKRRGQCKMAG